MANYTGFQPSLQMLCFYYFKFQIQFQFFAKFRFKLVNPQAIRQDETGIID